MDQNHPNTHDQYQIIFQNKIKQNTTKNHIIDSLAKALNKERKVLEPIFNKEKSILKKKLDWKTACRYFETFSSLGMITQIEVTLDSRCFRNAIVPVDRIKDAIKNDMKEIPEPPHAKNENKVESSSFPENTDTIWFETSRLNPALFTLPNTIELFHHAGKSYGVVKNPKYVVTNRLAYFIAVLTGFFLQVQFAFFFANTFGVSLTGIILSIIILITGIYLIGVFLTTRREIIFIKKKHSDNLLLKCIQVSRFNLFQRTYDIHDEKGKRIFKIKKNLIHQKGFCITENDEWVLSAEEEPDMDELLLDTAKEIRDTLIDLNFLDVIDAAKGFLHRNKPKKIFILRDSRRKAVGHFILAKYSVLKIYQDSAEIPDLRSIIPLILVLSGI